jgi:hypothetical protein
MINFYAEHFWTKGQRVKGGTGTGGGAALGRSFDPLTLCPFVLIIIVK